MTVTQALAELTHRLANAGISSYQLDAELLIAHALGHDRTFLYAHSDTTLEKSQEQALERMAHLREERVPLAYITGEKEFYGLSFSVNRAVLIPRPESETLIDTAREHLHDNRDLMHVVDVGTGSGCVGLALTHALPHLSVTLTDISERSLQCARKNADRLGILERVSFIKTGLIEGIGHPVHCIVANLPYLSQAKYEMAVHEYPEIAYEPLRALVAPDNGLAFIKELIRNSTHLLPELNAIFLEMNPEQIDECALFAKKFFSRAKTHQFNDLAGTPRVLGILTSDTPPSQK